MIIRSQMCMLPIHDFKLFIVFHYRKRVQKPEKVQNTFSMVVVTHKIISFLCTLQVHTIGKSFNLTFLQKRSRLQFESIRKTRYS